jgi:hypothetical protein
MNIWYEQIVAQGRELLASKLGISFPCIALFTTLLAEHLLLTANIPGFGVSTSHRVFIK